MSSPVTTPEFPLTNVNTERLIGCVKFFDNTAGFGFITVLKNSNFPQFSEKDIFFHFSAIHSVNEKQYKYLLKGEYVEFKIVPSANKTGAAVAGEDIKYNAIDITGIQGGKLMCETNYTEFVPKKSQNQNSFYGGAVGAAGAVGAVPNYHGKVSTNDSSTTVSVDMDVDSHIPFTRNTISNSTPNYVGRINRNRGPPGIPNSQRVPRQILRKPIVNA